MRKLTDEKIAELKAAHGELLVVEDEDGLPIVLRKPKRDEYMRYSDLYANPATESDANSNVVIACAVWPSQSEVRSAIDGEAAFANKITDQLDVMAGGEIGSVKAIPIGELTEEQRAKLSEAGCDLDKLRMTYPHLLALETRRGLWIARRPAKSVYDEFRRRTRTAGESIYLAGYRLTIDSIAWPNADIVAAALDVLPGMSTIIMPHLRDMAGVNRDIRAKKI